jgi:hypothetical protein
MNDDPKTESSKESPPATQSDKTETGEPSAEDQMAAYEDDLKNTDWGHQPC